MMYTLLVVVTGILVVVLGDELADALDNTINRNHADEYWMVPAICLLAIPILALIIIS